MENNKQAITMRIKSITYLGIALNIILLVVKVAISLPFSWHDDLRSKGKELR